MAISAITWRDAQEAPDDGRRYEAIEGDLYVTAAPSRRHQEVSGNLFVALRGLIHEPGLGFVYAAPIGVEFESTGEGVQPDIIVIARDRRELLHDDWIHGAPDLVIEILSPGTGRRDRTLKHGLYRRQGVGEYWIVNPLGDAIERWDFRGELREPQICRTEMVVRLGGEEVGTIDLAEVFARD